VTMHSYAFEQSVHEDYVIGQYDIKNTTAGTLSNLFVGLFFDWDMLPNYATNKTAFDSVRSLAYAWDDAAVNPIYCGARALDGAAGYRGLVNNLSIDLSRPAKFSWISEGVVPTDSIQDIHFVISSGPYTIPPNGTRAVAFALIGGSNLADLQANADAAQSKWDSIKTLVGVEDKSETVPNSFSLHQNYPNPFNPSTTISFDLPKTSLVSLKVFDVLGREVVSLVSGVREAGTHRIPFHAHRLTSGVYYYRLSAVDPVLPTHQVFVDFKKLLYVK
ncbi:MAG TPA: T9SS type A sorting domain-containing protein, partial [Bacteroidota bacterium]|nr:T9SS type A sorting domain-containing protein [Bacteroidota bacterium]